MQLMGQKLFSAQWKNIDNEHILDDQVWSSNSNFIIDRDWSGHELQTQWHFTQTYYPCRFFFSHPYMPQIMLLHFLQN